MTKYTKQRLLDMMNRVGGMPLNEVTGGLPPGFSSADVVSLDDFIKTPNLEEDTTGVEMQPANLRNIIDKRLGGDARDREDPYIHKKTIEIVDMNGNVINQDLLRKEMMSRPVALLGTNEKVGKTGILKISLPAYKGLYFDEHAPNGGEFKVVSTCLNAGDCKQYCFQQKGRSVMYDNAVLSKSRILNFLLNHWEEFKYKLIDEIETARMGNEKKGITTIMRWHDSGDFLSEKYLDLAMDIARRTPTVTHYAYTKMVSLAKGANVPSNFIFRFSVDAGAPENHLIDKLKDKHADVVPKELFKDLMHTTKVLVKKIEKNIWHYNSPESREELKNRVAQYYEINRSTVISFDEMTKIPEQGVNKWNVIVSPSDADTPAHRNDVLGVYLLIH
jgi:hypothetical protein